MRPATAALLLIPVCIAMACGAATQTAPQTARQTQIIVTSTTVLSLEWVVTAVGEAETEPRERVREANRAYVAYVRATRMVEVRRAEATALSDLAERARAMFETGQVARDDVATAEAATERARLNMDAAEDDLMQARSALAVVLEQPPDAALPPPVDLAATSIGRDLPGWLRRAREVRPDAEADALEREVTLAHDRLTQLHDTWVSHPSAPSEETVEAAIARFETGQADSSAVITSAAELARIRAARIDLAARIGNASADAEYAVGASLERVVLN